jgi:LytR cell envelope-related transcriptional attenuator
VLVVAAVVAVVVISVGGGSGATNTTQPPAAAVTHSGTAAPKAHVHRVSTESSSAAASPAETSVAVLNGTETAGLAHDVSGTLRQNGYTQATALNGRPPGANQVTVVEYGHGHQADAEGVARSLSVTKVQPIESATAALAGSATVVVVVGLDKAATVP